jgi:hypothetical protein
VLALAGLRAAGAEIGLGAASVREIATLNILHASMLAMRRAVAALPRRPEHILVDGNRVPGCPHPCTAIIGGDGISLSIAAASIAAKVTRDRLMARLALRYIMAGSGTRATRLPFTGRRFWRMGRPSITAWRSGRCSGRWRLKWRGRIPNAYGSRISISSSRKVQSR